MRRSQQFLGISELRQGDALQVFHGDVREMFVFATVVNGNNVRMRQPAGGLGFAEETQACLLEFLVFEFFLDRNDLQRNRTIAPLPIFFSMT